MNSICQDIVFLITHKITPTETATLLITHASI